VKAIKKTTLASLIISERINAASNPTGVITPNVPFKPRVHTYFGEDYKEQYLGPRMDLL